MDPHATDVIIEKIDKPKKKKRSAKMHQSLDNAGDLLRKSKTKLADFKL